MQNAVGIGQQFDIAAGLLQHEIAVRRVADVDDPRPVASRNRRLQVRLRHPQLQEGQRIFPERRIIGPLFRYVAIHQVLAELGYVEVTEHVEAMLAHPFGVIIHLPAGGGVGLAGRPRFVAGAGPFLVDALDRRDEHAHVGKIVGEFPVDAEGHFLHLLRVEGPLIARVRPAAGHLVERADSAD